MASVAPKDRRYLVVGFPRSGTTLLSRLLDAHPDISCPPETNLFSGAGRFLSEQTAVEGPPIGVLTGLGFLGIDADAVYARLRNLLFGLHEEIAGDATCWVEKTAADIFHLTELEPLLAGHARFVLLVRNPLDVVASNKDLADTMGAQLSELHEATRGHNSPYDGFAHAWVDAVRTSLDFAERHAEDCHVIRYEDLARDPETALAALLDFMKVEGSPADLVAASFTREPRVGLGDFRVHETSDVRAPVEGSWRTRLPRSAAARVLAIVEPLMRELGYDVPRVPSTPGREEAIRQFTLAASMKRSRREE